MGLAWEPAGGATSNLLINKEIMQLWQQWKGFEFTNIVDYKWMENSLRNAQPKQPLLTTISSMHYEKRRQSLETSSSCFAFTSLWALSLD